MLSVVIPCFNEEAVLPKLINRLRTVLDSLGEPYEAILVDDGSRDATASLLIAHQAVWPQLVVRVLSTNAGHQAALTAGLDVASGDLVVTMDADLQDPPEMIPVMVERARRNGVDVVYAGRSDRSSDSRFKRSTARVYYRLMRRFTSVEVPQDVGDFRLISRRVVLALRALPERDRVYRLLVPWLGFPSVTVEHVREGRAAGSTKYSVRHMLSLAVSSATSFTTTPLRLATAIGFTTALTSLLAALATIIAWAAGRTVPGWASLTVVVLFLGSVQLLCIGLLGEYVGRIYQEVQRRPLYNVDRDVRTEFADREVHVHVVPPAQRTA
jgi:glycosyltransferase involved in cell wall biosynthesis